MQIAGNTILITGGGSGIGHGLAEAFHKLGNQVIIAGRRQHTLNEVTAANPGMRGMSFDVADAESIESFALEVVKNFPALNVLINNSGIARMEQLTAQPAGVPDAVAMVTTNVLGPIRLTAALLPHLLAQPKAAVINNTSGLAFVPLALGPTYSATKAALHSYTESMRYQLKDTAVQVIELPPPYVQTELGGSSQANDPNAMPLEEYIDEVMSILTAEPDVREVLVDRVKPMRFAGIADQSKYDGFFTHMNDMFSAARQP